MSDVSGTRYSPTCLQGIGTVDLYIGELNHSLEYLRHSCRSSFIIPRQFSRQLIWPGIAYVMVLPKRLGNSLHAKLQFVHGTYSKAAWPASRGVVQTHGMTASVYAHKAERPR